jgi:phosphatidylserine decarboxylase
MLMMEVGALLVGKITNYPGLTGVARGQEKGMFQFGGSTVVLLLEPDVLEPDQDILRNSQAGEETIVKMGERIGQKIT